MGESVVTMNQNIYSIPRGAIWIDRVGTQVYIHLVSTRMPATDKDRVTLGEYIIPVQHMIFICGDIAHMYSHMCIVLCVCLLCLANLVAS